MLSLKSARVALPAPAWWNVSKTLMQTTVFWSTLLFVVPGFLAAMERRTGFDQLQFPSDALRVIGVVIFLACGTLGITSGMTMAIKGKGTPLPLDTARELVVAGPYRYVRNPMAIAGLGQGCAVGLYLGSPTVLVYVLIGGLLWNFLARPWEEADLIKRLGEAYCDYRKNVRCWIPRL